MRNKHINLISKNTVNSIKNRHIIDCAQTIDFIDKKDINTCTDLGSGVGLPGSFRYFDETKKPLFSRYFTRKVTIKVFF